MFYKKAVVKNLLIFSRKHLSWSLSFNKIAGVRPATLLKKRSQQRCFPVDIATFLRTSILKNIWERLFLYFRILKKMRKMKNDKSKTQKNRKSQNSRKNYFQFSYFRDQNSGLNLISHGVPQSSVLGPLLFIIFINNVHYAATHSKVWHFADDTNLLFANKSRKKIYKFINHDLALINKWLRANKISLNTSKTEIIIFRAKNNRIAKHVNFRISGQKVEPCT